MNTPRIDYTLTIEDTIELLGGKRPKTITRTGAAPVCALCGGLIIEGFREVTGRDAYLQDYSRVVRYCEECEGVVDDD